MSRTANARHTAQIARPVDYRNVQDAPSRKRPLLKVALAIVTVAASILVAVPVAQRTVAVHAAGAVSLWVNPVIGSWYVPTYFNIGPFAGQTENTMMTFTPNGGVVEVNPLNPSQANQGSWTQNDDGSYSYHLVEFTYSPTTTGVCQAVAADVTFRLGGSGNSFISTSTQATLQNYDPQTGQPMQRFFLPNVTNVSGQRITMGWPLPSSFAREPTTAQHPGC